MKYTVIMKDGSHQTVEAQTYDRIPPRFVFKNKVIKAGRAVDDVVLSIPMDDITTIQLAD